MVIAVYISDEMLSEGVEAMRESKVMCLTEAEMVWEIYLAMEGQRIKSSIHGEAPVH